MSETKCKKRSLVGMVLCWFKHDFRIVDIVHVIPGAGTLKRQCRRCLLYQEVGMCMGVGFLDLEEKRAYVKSVGLYD